MDCGTVRLLQSWTRNDTLYTLRRTHLLSSTRLPRDEEANKHEATSPFAVESRDITEETVEEAREEGGKKVRSPVSHS